MFRNTLVKVNGSFMLIPEDVYTPAHMLSLFKPQASTESKPEEKAIGAPTAVAVSERTQPRAPRPKRKLLSDIVFDANTPRRLLFPVAGELQQQENRPKKRARV